MRRRTSRTRCWAPMHVVDDPIGGDDVISGVVDERPLAFANMPARELAHLLQGWCTQLGNDSTTAPACGDELIAQWEIALRNNLGLREELPWRLCELEIAEVAAT
ncbi:unnamed protein product [Pedinophyceae sp. YPF-701]|nr:unnamed protein product [Pedinophyceae sp. YPF-701]